jgi:putative ABC transport system permease protein
VLIGLHQRTDVFRVQRQINAFGGEPLMAILPGLAMDELWQLMGSVERTLHGLAWLVMAAGLAGLVAVIVASLGERRRELAILRSVGAGRRHIVGLLVLEGAMVTAAGIVLGVAVVEAAGHLLALAQGPPRDGPLRRGPADGGTQASVPYWPPASRRA